MKKNMMKVCAAVLAAAVYLGQAAPACAFPADYGQGGGALEQIGITAAADNSFNTAIPGIKGNAWDTTVAPSPVPDIAIIDCYTKALTLRGQSGYNMTPDEAKDLCRYTQSADVTTGCYTKALTLRGRSGYTMTTDEAKDLCRYTQSANAATDCYSRALTLRGQSGYNMTPDEASKLCRYTQSADVTIGCYTKALTLRGQSGYNMTPDEAKDLCANGLWALIAGQMK